MQNKYLKIEEGQYLTNILKEIPSNTIIHKVLTGLGATHLEINCERNSIIIEPNVPVIHGKSKKHKNVFPVYEGVTVFHIRNYLFNDKYKYKKIMTTPESFEKVKSAMEDLQIDMYQDYFLLYDECDRTSKDVDFRKNIIKPMNDFFMFDRKAFISATATTPSDPRFYEQQFELLIIEPTYDYSRPLKIVTTNNPKASLRMQLEIISKIKSNQPVFVFFNSVRGIISAIEDLKVEEMSAVFCSKQSVSKIKKGSVKAYPDFEYKKISPLNFMTSRYYSALDIELGEGIKPHVIMVTDLNVAPHSMIDPSSDAIQIPGRFRNGISSLCYVTNWDNDLHCKSKQEAKEYLSGCRSGYMEIKKLRDVSQNSGMIDSLTEALTYMFYSDFLDENGNKNYYMYDNYLDQQRVKSYFQSPSSIVKGFEDKCKGQFTIEHEEDFYKISSKYFKIKNIKNFREHLKGLVDMLEIIIDEEGEHTYNLFDRQSVYDSINREYPYIVKAYRLLGKDELIAKGYCKESIEEALLHHEQKRGFQNFDFLKELRIKFPVNSDTEQSSALTLFFKLVGKYGLKYGRRIEDFQRFFKIVIKKRNKGTRYIRIVERRFK